MNLSRISEVSSKLILRCQGGIKWRQARTLEEEKITISDLEPLRDRPGPEAP